MTDALAAWFMRDEEAGGAPGNSCATLEQRTVHCRAVGLMSFAPGAFTQRRL